VEEDAGAVRGVAEQAEHEEQQGQALAGPLALVLDDLRDARTQIADGARVAQDLGAQGNGLLVAVGDGLGDPDAALPRNGPACSADGQDAEDAERVLDPLAGGVVDVEDGGERGCAAAARGLAVAPVAAGESDVGAIAASEEGRFD
jgi:hypothetical protein